MSGDEVVVSVASLVVGPLAWILWLYMASTVQHRRQSHTLNVIAGALVASAILIFIVLRTAASFDVVDDARYQVMYLLLGLAWLRVAQLSFAVAGVSGRDDVVERGNPAAAITVGGALIGTAICYAGGNIGDGPGWWVVVFCAALATATLLVCWLILTAFTSITDAVVIDRDRAAGLRLAGFLIALAVVLGRGVAGDWRSGAETIADFVAILPWAALILLLAAGVERAVRPTPERPQGSILTAGLFPASVYLALAAGVVNFLGWPA